MNTRLPSPSEASVITKPHRVVKKKVTILSFPTVNLVCWYVSSISVLAVIQTRQKQNVFNKVDIVNLIVKDL